jgi:hypothetical protein
MEQSAFFLQPIGAPPPAPAIPPAPAMPPPPASPPLPPIPLELADEALEVSGCACLALQAAKDAPTTRTETTRTERVMRMLDRLVSVFIECLTENYECE